MIELREVTKTYPARAKPVEALREIDLLLERGSYTALIGRSGSGKSTLLAVLGLVEGPSDGSYLLDGEDTMGLSDAKLSHLRARTFGFVFQDFHLLPNRRAWQNVAFPMQFTEMPRSERRPRATSLLERVGLGDKMSAFPTELSGGEQQRVAIARALANRPSVLLADEPTGNLDTITRDAILDLLSELHEAGATLVVATHDAEVAKRAQRVIELCDGRLCGVTAGHSAVDARALSRG